MRTLYSMKAIIRDKQIEEKAWKMILSNDAQFNALGYTIFNEYIKRYKFFIEIRKDYISTLPEGYRKRVIEDNLKRIAKSNETKARFGNKNTKTEKNEYDS